MDRVFPDIHLVNFLNFGGFMPDVESQAYIRFEERTEEDRAQTMEQGHYVVRNVDFIVIVPPGDGKTVLEQKVNDRHKFRYKKEYDAWKQGKEAPLNGTSIKDWPSASPAIIMNLQRINVRTIEDLANANESTLERIGMGARKLKEKASAWLQASEGPGKMTEAMTELSRRMDEMDTASSEKDDLIAELLAENEGLRNVGLNSQSDEQIGGKGVSLPEPETPKLPVSRPRKFNVRKGRKVKV